MNGNGGGGGGKGLFLVIVVIALSLTVGLTSQSKSVGAPKKKEGAPTLAGMVGDLQAPAVKLSKALQKQLKKLFKVVKKGKGRIAKVPKGLSFTNGAGCRPKGDWKRVDSRVRKVLTQAVKRGYSVRVSCLRSGHSKFVKGTRNVSNHHAGRGVDLDRVNGRPVRSGNRAARNLALLLGYGKLGAQPSEVGSPWFTAGIFFTDSGHKGHLHVGFRGR